MTEYHQVWIWGGIFLCLTQSAMFSGLNLAFFCISRLRLQVEAAGGNRDARKVLRMRENANFLLCTILWGNVGIITNEGEPLDPKSCIPMPIRNGAPYLSRFTAESDGDFLQTVDAAGQKWVLLLDSGGYPEYVLDADGFLRNALFRPGGASLQTFCHRPVIVTDPAFQLGEAMRRLEVRSPHPSDDVIDQDVILLWSKEKRIITGSDILGRLLRGIVPHQLGPG